jgi:hypothetical protein
VLIFLSQSPNQDDVILNAKDAQFQYTIDMDFSRNSAAIHAHDQCECNISYLPNVLNTFANVLEAMYALMPHESSPADAMNGIGSFFVTY